MTPKHWPERALGDVCEMYQPKTISQKEMVADGPYPVFGANGVIGRFDKYNHEERQLLITCRGATCGSVNISEPFSWVTGNAMVVRPKDVNLDLRFTEFFFRGAIDLEGVITGAAQPQITRKSLAPVKIPIPPLDEQKRIVAVLDQAFAALDRARALAEANLADAAELFDTSLRVIFATTAEGKAVHTLDEITKAIVDCEHKTAPVSEAGYPSIRTPNVGNGVLKLDGVNRVSEKTYQEWTRRAIPESGDLIMAREAPAGNVAVIPEGEKVCLGQRTLLIKPDRESTDPSYLALLLLHPIMQRRLLEKSAGATVQHVNMKDIRALPVPILPSMAVQRECSKRFNEVRVMVKLVEVAARKKIQDLTLLRQSLLQKAFSGQLT